MTTEIVDRMELKFDKRDLVDVAVVEHEARLEQRKEELEAQKAQVEAAQERLKREFNKGVKSAGYQAIKPVQEKLEAAVSGIHRRNVLDYEYNYGVLNTAQVGKKQKKQKIFQVSSVVFAQEKSGGKRYVGVYLGSTCDSDPFLFPLPSHLEEKYKALKDLEVQDGKLHQEIQEVRKDLSKIPSFTRFVRAELAKQSLGANPQGKKVLAFLESMVQKKKKLAALKG